MTNNKNNTGASIQSLLVGGAIFLSAVVVTVNYWFRAIRSNPGFTPTPTVNSAPTSPNPLVKNSPDPYTGELEATRRPRSQVDYTKLEEYLQKKDWRAADKETYERLLEAAGPRAVSDGQIHRDEMELLSCDDLKLVDGLWRKNSNGKFGFAIQRHILRRVGSWQNMYETVGWRKLSGEWLIQVETAVQPNGNFRLEFLPGKEPNYTDNAPMGHLPFKERAYNFEVGIDDALRDCSF